MCGFFCCSIPHSLGASCASRVVPSHDFSAPRLMLPADDSLASVSVSWSDRCTRFTSFSRCAAFVRGPFAVVSAKPSAIPSGSSHARLFSCAGPVCPRACFGVRLSVLGVRFSRLLFLKTFKTLFKINLKVLLKISWSKMSSSRKVMHKACRK